MALLHAWYGQYNFENHEYSNAILPIDKQGELYLANGRAIWCRRLHAHGVVYVTVVHVYVARTHALLKPAINEKRAEKTRKKNKRNGCGLKYSVWGSRRKTGQKI